MGDDQGHGESAGVGAEGDEASTSPGTSSRRDFLKLGGAAAAGAVVGGGVGAAIGASIGHALGYQEGADDFTAFTPREEPGIDHLVVVDGREPIVRQPARLAVLARRR